MIEDQNDQDEASANDNSLQEENLSRHHIQDDISMGSASSHSSESTGITKFTTLYGNKSNKLAKRLQTQRSEEFTKHDSTEDQRITRLEQDIAALKAMKDVHAIIFCSLGFRSREEEESWLLLYSPTPVSATLLMYTLFVSTFMRTFSVEILPLEVCKTWQN